MCQRLQCIHLCVEDTRSLLYSFHRLTCVSAEPCEYPHFPVTSHFLDTSCNFLPEWVEVVSNIEDRCAGGDLFERFGDGHAVLGNPPTVEKRLGLL